MKNVADIFKTIKDGESYSNGVTLIKRIGFIVEIIVNGVIVTRLDINDYSYDKIQEPISFNEYADKYRKENAKVVFKDIWGDEQTLYINNLSDLFNTAGDEYGSDTIKNLMDTGKFFVE